MIRLAPCRSLMLIMALIAGFFSLVIQSLPSGTLICLESTGHIALESNDAHCCGSTTSSDDGTLVTGIIECKQCTDLLLPHNHSDQLQLPTTIVHETARDLSVVALIDWPPVNGPTWAAHRHALVRPPHLLQTETIIIRC